MKILHVGSPYLHRISSDNPSRDKPLGPLSGAIQVTPSFIRYLTGVYRSVLSLPSLVDPGNLHEKPCTGAMTKLGQSSSSLLSAVPTTNLLHSSDRALYPRYPRTHRFRAHRSTRRFVSHRTIPCTATDYCAGSLAATWQSWIGNVAAGSIFATIQSWAMKGLMKAVGFALLPLARWLAWFGRWAVGWQSLRFIARCVGR